MKLQIKAVTYFILAMLFGAVALVTLTQIVFLISSDIMSGVLVGEPETGWGFMIALYFYAPIITTFILLFLWAFKQYKGIAGKKFIWLLLVTAAMTALIFYMLAHIYWG